MDKRPPEDQLGADHAAKRGRWDVPSALTPAAAAAAAQAAAVAAKYAQPSGLVPGFALGASTALTPGAAAAVAQAAAAAIQKLPLGVVAGVPPTQAGRSGAAPSLSLDALEKAKKALQLQKEIQEKLKARLPQLAAKLPGAATSAAALAGQGSVPSGAMTPLMRPLLPPSGGPPGFVSVRPPPPGMRPPMPGVRPPLLGVRPPLGSLAHLAGSSKQPDGLASLMPPPPAPAPEEPEEAGGAFYDPALARGTGGRRADRRRRAGFDFVHEGHFQRQAELVRLKSHLGSGAFRKGGPRVSGPLGEPSRMPLGGAAAGLDPNMVPLGTRVPAALGEGGPPAAQAEVVPSVEWWDRGLLAHASLDQDVPEVPYVDQDVDQVVDQDMPEQPAEGAAANGGADAHMEEAGSDGGKGGGAGAAGGGADGAAAARRERRRRAAAAALAAAADSAAAGRLGPFHLKEARLTHYVEHPVPLEPPAEAPPPAPQPLQLTRKELKKLRTQRRLARDKEKQELIRQGLLEPPKPKVRIANLHRVLGTDAALDPTAVEREVRKQMAERQAAHDDRNLARKLTPAERREKKLRKLFGSAAVDAGVADVGGARAGGGGRGAAAAAAAAAAAGLAAGVDVVCSVYRVGRLTDPVHRLKIDMNARENHMTGISIASDDVCVVVVEGVDKATRRFHKLMTRRIDWSTAPLHMATGGGGGGGGGRGHGSDEDEEEEEERPPNTCTLVWQGTVLRRAFAGFRAEVVRSAAAGRQLLDEVGVGHYWDAAATAAAEDGRL